MTHPQPGRRRRRAGALALSTALLAMSVVTMTTSSATAAPPPDRPGRGQSAEALAKRADREGPLRLVVEVDSPRSGPGVADQARRNGATGLRTLDRLPYVSLRAGSRAIRSLEASPRVRGIWEDVPSSPHLASTIPVVNADDTQALGWTGAGRSVVVLDTGIDADHPFFFDNNGNPAASRILAQRCFSDPDAGGDAQRRSLCPNGGTTDTDADVDGHAECTAAVSRCDHGTHVAGIAAGDATGLTGAPGNGVAPDAGIVAIQVFTRFNRASDCPAADPAPCLLTFQADQLAGLNEALNLATANPGWRIDAVNMSLGGGSNASACDGDARKAAVDALLAAGISTVISSGNSGFLNAVGAPGCISTAVTVGNSADDDTVWPSSNRGPLLDLFAPGGQVVSAVVDDTYGSKSGTSMSAPHVAGAFAVLRQAYPTRTAAQLLADMATTGVPITYATNATGTTTQTTPRLDLLGALQQPNSPPELTADPGSSSVDEGSVLTRTGTVSDPEGDPVTGMTASIGTVTDDGGTWTWSWRPADGPVDSQTVTITATDDKGETGTVSLPITVANVAPSVAVQPLAVVQEGQTVTVTAEFTDPGWLDTHVATIDWGVPASHAGEEVAAPVLTVTDPGGPGQLRRGTVTGTYRYGDDDAGGGFPVTVEVTDKDGGSGSAVRSAQVTNVAPTVAVDLSGAQSLGGVPTIVSSVGQSVPLSSTTTDPGSDDLSLQWSFGDGGTALLSSLVDPPGSDPLPSPTVQARNVEHAVTHAYGDACTYTATSSATDDDGGAAASSVAVLVTGVADLARSSGYWSAEYRGKRHSDFTAATLDCYLAITRHVSSVFNEHRALASSDDAAAVLKTSGSSSSYDLLDAQLLAAWLNFANGAYSLDELVDTDGDGTPDTAFSAVLAAAEGVRLDPTRTRAEVLAAKDRLERLNNP